MDVNGSFNGKIIYRGPASHVSLPEGTWSLNMQNGLKTVFRIGFFFLGEAAFNTELLGGWNYMELYTWMGLHVHHASLKKSITSWCEIRRAPNKNIMTAPKKMCLSKIPFDPSIRLYQSSWNQKSRLFKAHDCPFASALRQCHDRRGSSPGRVSQRTTSPTFRPSWTGPLLSQHFPARHSGAR